MNFLKYLNEVWDSTVKIDWGKGKPILFDIYTNPSSSDYTELRKKTHSDEVRFVIDRKKSVVYVWNDNALHYQVMRKLSLDKRGVFIGHGRIVDNKIKAETFGNYMMVPGSSDVTFPPLKSMQWAEKYFSNLEYFI